MTEEAAGIGHNSTAARELQSIVSRIESLESEKKELQTQITEVYAEAKGSGFDVPTLRQVVKLRKATAEERAAKEALLDTYLHALGMLADTPLGMASARGEFGPQVDIEDAIAARTGEADTEAPKRRRGKRVSADERIAKQQAERDGIPPPTADPVGADLTGPDQDEGFGGVNPEITGALDAAEGAAADAPALA